MKIELTPIEALIVSQALSMAILESQIHPDDRLIAYEVKQKVFKAAREQLPESEEE